MIEDEEAIAVTLSLALTREGYEVVVVRDGRSALEMITPNAATPFSQPPTSDGMERSDTYEKPPIQTIETIDLVILDLMLPYVNGLDLCRLIRREGYQVPILIVSAKSSELDRVVGLEVGADDYLTKPFGMRELLARCRALLRRHLSLPQTIDPEPITIEEITLYPQECRVVVRGEEISISPKEFRLLELFMRYPRRVWSREELLEQVWGKGYMGDSKTVDVHIRWLREKLETDPSDPQYLVTVRGFGYRLEQPIN